MCSGYFGYSYRFGVCFYQLSAPKRNQIGIDSIVKIYPISLADMYKDQVGTKYQPCNGTEGDFFISQWCGNCARDKSLREGEHIEYCHDDEICNIVTNTMALDVSDPRYPSEWQYGKDGQPCCTAFIPAGEPIPKPIVKDEHTIDMFAAMEHGKEN